MKLLAPLREEIDRGQTGDLTGWSSLVPTNRRHRWDWLVVIPRKSEKKESKKLLYMLITHAYN